VTYRKKLIEVALPLEAINKASAREKSIRHGHPSTLHLWWARRPLAAARAVIFAQMVDDPSSWPDLFPTEQAQEKERKRLFTIIEDLVQWENTTNEEVLERARAEIWASWRRACAENADHPRAKELFDRNKLPAFHDPFAGGGSLPLEAQRLGLEAYASDLNPVAVLINKAMIEIPPKFAGRPPVNPEARKRLQVTGDRLQGEEGNGEHPVASRPGRLAEGDGSRRDGVPTDAALSEERDLRSRVAVDTRHGVGAREHRGGQRQGVAEGLRELSRDRKGLVDGGGDFPDARGSSGVPAGGGRPAGTGADGGNQQDADRFAHQTPVTYNLFPITYRSAQGLAEDVRYYGQWMRDEAEKRIGHLYPKVTGYRDKVTGKIYGDPSHAPVTCNLSPVPLTVIAWLWARTVKSPNPAFANVDVPLASTFMLSTKSGKEAYVEPVIEGGGYRFTVKVGKPKDTARAKNGTKLARGANFECLMSATPISDDYIKAESMAGRMGARLMAIVAEGERGRVYLAPTPEHEAVARSAEPKWKPDQPMNRDTRDLVSGRGYGFFTWADLFTPRQLVALTTFSDLVGEAMAQVRRDALAAGLPDDPTPLRDGGTGASAYAEAVGVYLAMSISKMSDAQSSLCRWKPTMDQSIATFGRQALPIVWDFSEANALGGMAGDPLVSLKNMMRVVDDLPATGRAVVAQADAQSQTLGADKVVSTDPPYYDNIGYADLSDFFYVWLRRSLRNVYPDLFGTVAAPKAEELVATPYRHGSKEKAETFFLDGMTQAMHRLVEQAHPAFPVTIYYAFKQSETESAEGTSSTGWETFLDAVIRAGFGISGTWPMRTELGNRMIGSGTNALASSIVLVCRKRAADAPTATRREFVAALKAELPGALRRLQEGNIAPVDLAQAAIGPGMAVYTRYARVLDAEGKPVPVREALALINQVLDETLAEQEGDFDADSRWALAWFEQHGFEPGEFGVAETLSKAKNTSIDGLVESGILESRRGKVRLLKPSELPVDWDPEDDRRTNVWEMLHHLVRVLEHGGERAAAELVRKYGAQAEIVRELAYRLYTLCERKKRAQEALRYNALVQSWPEISRLAREGGEPKTEQAVLFEETEE
jgi:putative DNA methylase